MFSGTFVNASKLGKGNTRPLRAGDIISACVSPIQAKDGTWTTSSSNDKFRTIFVAYRLATEPLHPAAPVAAAVPCPDAAALAKAGSAATQGACGDAPGAEVAERRDTVLRTGDSGAHAGPSRQPTPHASQPMHDDVPAAGGTVPGAGGLGGADQGPADACGAGRLVALDALDALDSFYTAQPVDGARCARGSENAA